MRVRQLSRFGFGVVLAAFFVWLMARQTSAEELLRAFAGTSAAWLAAALVMFVVGYASRIARWHAMLVHDNPALTWCQCAGPLLGSFAANNVLPFRAGDVLRAFAFNDRLGASPGPVLATIFVERLLDLLMVLLLLAAALAIFGLEANSFWGLGRATLFAMIVVIVGLLLYPAAFAPLAQALGKLVARLSPRIGQILLEEINKSFSKLGHLAKGRTMARLLLWSAAVWLAEGGVFWLSAMALGSLSMPAAAWLALPVGTLATLIPSTPGYLGTFDYFTARAMTAMGNATAAAAAYAILVHALLWLPVTLLGGAYLLVRPVRRAALQVES